MNPATSAHTERPARTHSGYLMAALGAIALIGGMALFFTTIGAFLPNRGTGSAPLLSAMLTACAMVGGGTFVLVGLYMLQPNECVLLTLFGSYVGTDRQAGLRWTWPFVARRRLSLRARNLNAPTLKVNDKRGNPVEIGAVVIWQVRDTAQAVFDIDDFERYVGMQAEAALRHLANLYAYDDGEDLAPGEHTLRGGVEAVSQALQSELRARFAPAGVEVVDARLSHLAYAPEIAQVMLRRQQAEAIISARSRIVHGAVSMVEAALKGLSEREIVVLDDERKAAMVSNLLVVLCSDKDAQPVLNTGTLYN
jgi:regulator of protease activity HflC (stomatin/prohibitin superfamily)